MSRIPPRRKIALLLLAVFLSAPWALGAAPSGAQAQSSEQSSPALLRHLWGLLTALWNETGCHIDPSGGCTQVQSLPPAASSETGCHIDPNGCARAGAAPPAIDHVDVGCHIDPGGCAR